MVWFWYDSMQARERTLAACRRACRRINAQLLDETVALDRMRLARRQGQLVIARRYRFEFSLAGDDRRAGWVHLLGSRITDLQMEYPEGLVMEPVSPSD
jgi:hypothetical protein